MYAYFYPLEDFLKFGIIGALNMGVQIFYIVGTLASLFFYLHLLCYTCYLKFKNISEKIKRAAKQSNLFTERNLIKQILDEYNDTCITLTAYNKFWRIVIFIIYMIFLPQACLMLILSIRTEPLNLAWLMNKIGLAFGALMSILFILLFALSGEFVATKVMC